MLVHANASMLDEGHNCSVVNGKPVLILVNSGKAACPDRRCNISIYFLGNRFMSIKGSSETKATLAFLSF